MTMNLVLLLLITQIATIVVGAYLYRGLNRRLAEGRDAEADQALKQSVAELLSELEISAERATQGLARQRATLTRLVREADRRIQVLPDAADLASPPPLRRQPAGEARRTPGRASAWQDLAIRLAEDGLSESAIARQLRIGVEEVRLTLATRGIGA